MKFEAFDAAVRRLPGTEFDVKWGADRTYCVGGRMFVVAGRLGEETPRYLFKASEMSFALLTEAGLAEPAPYLARASWVRLVSGDALTEAELLRYVSAAHGLIAAKLPRRTRLELGLPG